MRRWDDTAQGLMPQQSYAGGVAVTTLRPGFDLVLCEVAGSDAEPFEHEEAEDLIGIGFHLKGGADFAVEDQAFRTKPGDCWIVASPKGSKSVFSVGEAGLRTASVRLTPTAAEALFHDEGPFPTLAARARNAVALRPGGAMDARRMKAVDELFTSPYDGAAQRLMLESAALSLLAWQIETFDDEVVPAQALARRDHALMELARERLDTCLDAPPTLMGLAHDLGINDFKLKRDFKRAFGSTVFGYVREQRMRRAADHLRQGLSVQQAALDVGYACSSRFAQAFRQHYGLTPSAFRGGSI